MKKYFGIIFSVIIIAFSLTLILMPKQEFSENENRYLETFPKFNLDTLSDGSFMTDLETYVQDHFPFRNTFVNVKTNSEILLGKTENNGVYIANNEYLIEKNSYVENKRLDRIAAMFNILTQNSSGAHTTVLIVPTSISINEELLPDYATQYSEKERIDYIYSKLNLCDTLDLYDELNNANSTSQMYYKTDHHWTTEAAYLAYTKYIDLIKDHTNTSPVLLDSLKKEIFSDDFYGTTYSKANLYNVSADTITAYINEYDEFEVTYSRTKETLDTMYNRDYLDKKDKYATFLNENQELVVIKNKSLKNGKNILVIKDSYANCFIPFLANSFDTTHVIDPRYYVGSITDYIEQNNIDEVLILYNIHTLVTDQGIFNIK